MRKFKITIFAIVSVAFLSSSFGLVLAQTLSQGMQNQEVKNIQEILKSDSTIYPQGLVTGYYGRLTEEAVKKLQERCGISDTGNVDPNTLKCIYLIGYQVRVVSPNGGETWDRNQVQTIKWEVISPVVEGMKSSPFWSKASVDLFRTVRSTPPCSSGQTCPEMILINSVFVKHITTVNFFDGTYSWNIDNNILNGSDYVIRISVGKNIVPLWHQELSPGAKIDPEEIWSKPDTSANWDESDGPFTITGEVKPQPNPDIDGVIKILEKILQDLATAIGLLKGMSVTH